MHEKRHISAKFLISQNLLLHASGYQALAHEKKYNDDDDYDIIIIIIIIIISICVGYL
jgi:hypothetical protein